MQLLAAEAERAEQRRRPRSVESLIELRDS
jgi:hypothetical protein